MECPLYMAYLTMGAISKDKIGLKLSVKDSANLQFAIHERREKKRSATDGR